MRPGHHRPLGTTAWMRFPDWDALHQPRLGDVAQQVSAQGMDDADAVRRSYVLVGVEETRTGYRLLLERVEHGTVPDPADLAAGAGVWSFYNLPRR